MLNAFDVIVIGGGPGGYVCAIKAAQLGLSVACVEVRKALGGTCLNVGCIPSKTLLEFTEKAYFGKHLLKEGIFEGKLSVNWEKLMKKKEGIVDSLTKGIAGLFKKNKVVHINGFASFKNATTVAVKMEDGTVQELSGKNIVIATGSTPVVIPGITVDEEVIVTSTGALSLRKVPGKMVVIGAGVIGLEMASIYSRLGAEIEVVEFLDKITPSMDSEVSRTFKKILEEQGIKFRMSTKVLSAKKVGSGAEVEVETEGKKEVLKADVVLLAIGRRPFTSGLGLENAGVLLNERGFVMHNGHLKTNIPGIYVIGDATTGLMLAHKAEEEGIAVAEILAGQAGHVNYEVIPAVVYTHPEVAAVGKTEEELKAAGIEYNIGKFSMMANSRAKAVDDTAGFVKVLACKKSDKILGCHIIGRGAGDIIQEIAMAMEFSGSAEDVARTSHPHPQFGEAIKEACLAAFSKPIHS